MAIEDIYFKEYVCSDFRDSRNPLPEDIKIGRNRAIMLAIPEIICCLAAFGLYEVRRSRLILAVNFMNIIMTAVGIRAKLKLSYWGLLLHGLYCVSVIGGFYIYFMIDFLMTKDRKNSSAGHRDKD